jgi:hypothetical protein
MNFTTAGLARIKAPEFLLKFDQLLDFHSKITFLVIAVCSGKDGLFAIPTKDELRHELQSFLRSHYEQLINLMIEAESDVAALQDTRCEAEVRCPKCNARVTT